VGVGVSVGVSALVIPAEVGRRRRRDAYMRLYKTEIFKIPLTFTFKNPRKCSFFSILIT